MIPHQPSRRSVIPARAARNRISWCFLGLLVVVCVGCKKVDGPVRYEVSGEVKYGDQLLEYGTIQFLPDAQQGNRGLATSARIQRGRFKTPSGKGVVGGPHLLRIYAFEDDASGNPNLVPLFPMYEKRVDLPMAGTSIDVIVPATHGE